MDGIAAEQVWKSYGGRAVLRGVTFRVPAGGRMALSAPSGAGKTTLLRLFLRLETPDRGTIRGPDRWAAVFQEDRLLDHLDGLANLRLVLGRDYDRDRAAELLDALGLGDVPGKRVRDYSGGMRRRLALARALLSPAEALALDEPFTGLDDDSRRRCVNAILRLGAGRTILLASHDARDALDLGAETLNLPHPSTVTTG